jgi:hypothetical protein
MVEFEEALKAKISSDNFNKDNLKAAELIALADKALKPTNGVCFEILELAQKYDNNVSVLQALG